MFKFLVQKDYSDYRKSDKKHNNLVGFIIKYEDLLYFYKEIDKIIKSTDLFKNTKWAEGEEVNSKTFKQNFEKNKYEDDYFIFLLKIDNKLYFFKSKEKFYKMMNFKNIYTIIEVIEMETLTICLSCIVKHMSFYKYEKNNMKKKLKSQKINKLKI